MRTYDHWWKGDEYDVHESLYVFVKSIEKEHDDRTLFIADMRRAYDSGAPINRDQRRIVHDVLHELGGTIGGKKRVWMNTMQSVVDTAVAMVASSKPRAKFTTNNGDFKMRQKARLCDQYSEGLMHRWKFHRLAHRALTDAAVSGDGWLHVYKHAGRVELERVNPTEIMVPDKIWDEPRTMVRCKDVSAEVLIAQFKDHPRFDAAVEKKIRDAAPSDRQVRGGLTYVDDLVKVYEAWHRPSVRGADDGRHVICIEGCTLMDEPWEYDYFPIVMIPWQWRPGRFFGRGIVESLYSLQNEFNRMLQRVSDSIHILSVPMVFYQNGTVNPDHFKNRPGVAIGVDGGSMPVFQTPQTVANDAYQHMWRLYDAHYEAAGVSKMSATGLKPGDRLSGVARMYELDSEARRIFGPGSNYEMGVVETIKIAIDCTRSLYKDGDNTTVKYVGKDFMKKIDWSDIDLDEDVCEIRPEASSMLPTTPSGKRQALQEYLAAGLIDVEEARAHIDITDTGEMSARINADRRLVERQVDIMLSDGEPQYPMKHQNLPLALKHATALLQQAAVEGADEERLGLVSDYIEEVEALIEASLPPEPEAPLPEEPLPPADPTAIGV